jgi:6-phosphofructokinase 1
MTAIPGPEFTVERLGECRHASPLQGVRFTADDERILHCATLAEVEADLGRGVRPAQVEVAGPRERIFFDPARTACGIVTCGGLCPGINDVIRAVVLSLHHHYGVKRIYGFRYGYEGLVRDKGRAPWELTPASVSRINESGGTVLGSSRGPQDPAQMVETLVSLDIDLLIAIGGDGTLKGANAIAVEARRRGLEIAVVGVPKTIDNDISFVQTTFGFDTAVAEAKRATYAAHSEAEGARNGIGLVKLMGRDSGFIAAFTALVDSQVNFCLVPEVSFTLPGFLRALTARLEQRSHAVVVVAEGAGQDLLPASATVDASGNRLFGDIGVFLRDEIRAHFRQAGVPVSLKYIDPSYIIRSVPANPRDAAFCLLLGQNAVHAGMTGRTGMVVGFWNHRFTHVPIALAASQRKKIDPEGPLWNAILAATGQPRNLID